MTRIRRRTAAAVLALASPGALAGLPASAIDPCTLRVLVLSAFPGEIDQLLTTADITDTVTIDGRNFFAGTLAGNDVLMGLTGIGLVNADRTARAAFATYGCGIAGVVFSGVSGGHTSIGDVTVPRRWTLDGGTTFFDVDPAMLATVHEVAGSVELARSVPLGDLPCAGVDPGLVRTVELAHEPALLIGGSGRSSDPFDGRTLPCFPGTDVFGCEPCRAPVRSAPDVERFAENAVPFIDPAFFFYYFENQPSTSPDYDAGDMETAAVARVAAEHDAPFIAFRALSDGEGDPLMLPGFPFQFFVYRQVAANNAATTALAFLEAWAAE